MTERRTTRLPPRGWVRGEDPDTGERFWFDPLTAKQSEPRTVLTEEQRARIKKCQWALREHDPRPLDEWLLNFSRDEHPDREIEVYEAIVAAYREELQLRPGAGKGERHLVYWAVLTAANCEGRVDAVLASRPELKACRNLARAVAAFGNHYFKP
jgi:hypothetical protein